ncbi:hypothetical protein B7494_g4162 [Chlorociboria aeruginascens]|nr:hypothetical protein B7494_g4162 [Chlorociboria aeruginascens]
MSSTTLSITPTSTSTATPSCISVTPGKNGYIPEWACNSNYNYNPSFAAAVVFAVLFGLTTFCHIYQAGTYKKWRLCWVVIMGSAWEFASFAIRSAGTRHQQSNPLAYASQILVLLAPMWVNAFDYMVMGRMIHFFAPNRKIWGIPGIQIGKIFVWLDILSFFTQVGGGIMISPGASESTLMTGIHVYMGGIGFQQFCILIFTSIAIRFFFVMRKPERNLNVPAHQVLDGRPTNWRSLLYALFGSLVLIMIRIIFRMVEFAKGLDPSKNPIPYHEAYFLLLDALPMFFSIATMNAVHPGRILQGEGSEFPKGPTRKEKKEIKRQKKEAKKQEKEEKKLGKDKTILLTHNPVGYAHDLKQTALHSIADTKLSRDQFSSNVSALLSKDPPPDIDGVDRDGDTPLLVTFMGSADAMYQAEILLDFGTNIYSVNKEGRNVFGAITANKALLDEDSLNYIRTLLLRLNNRSEKLAFKNFEQSINIALWDAAMYARSETLKLLLDVGMSTHISDIYTLNAERTVLDLALDYGEPSRTA